MKYVDFWLCVVTPPRWVPSEVAEAITPGCVFERPVKASWRWWWLAIKLTLWWTFYARPWNWIALRLHPEWRKGWGQLHLKCVRWCCTLDMFDMEEPES